MQVKNKMRYYYKPSPMAKMRKSDHIRCWQGREVNETLIYCWVEYKLVQPL